MAEGDFSVKAVINADTKNFEKGMKQAQSSANNLSNTFGNLSKVITKALSFTGLALGTKAVVDFGKKCLSVADEVGSNFSILNQTIEATGASIWTNAESMDKMAKAYSETTNYSKNEIYKMQSVLLGFKNVTGETFEDASDAILDMATVMGMDLTSAVQTVGKALDDPVKGLDSLRRQGFQFTDEQKEELAQLVKNGKQLEAQKIILDELNTSYGGTAKVGQDAFAKLKHSMEDFQAEMGTNLMPLAQHFGDVFYKSFEGIAGIVRKIDFQKITVILKNVTAIVDSKSKEIKNKISKLISDIKSFIGKLNLEPLKVAIGSVILALRKSIEQTKQNISSTIERTKGVIQKIDFNEIIKKVSKVTIGVSYLFTMIIDLSKDVTDWVLRMWNKIKGVFDKASENLANSGTDITSYKDLIWSSLNSAFKTIQDLIYSVKAIFQGDWSLAWNYFKLACLRACDAILNAFSTLMNAFPNVVNKMIDGLNWLIEEINKMRSFFGQKPINLLDAFESVDLSEKTGLSDLIEKTEKEISDKTGKIVDRTLDELGHFSDESKKEYGKTSKVIKELSDDTTETIIDNSEKATEKTKESVETQKNLFKEIYSKIKEISTKYPELTDIFSSISENAKSVFNKLFDNLGEQLANGKADWVDFGETVISAMEDVGDSISDALGKLAMNSATSGNWIVAGIAMAGSLLTKLVNSIMKATLKISNTVEKVKADANSINDTIEKASLGKSMQEFNNNSKILSDKIKEIRKNIEQLGKDYETTQKKMETPEWWEILLGAGTAGTYFLGRDIKYATKLNEIAKASAEAQKQLVQLQIAMIKLEQETLKQLNASIDENVNQIIIMSEAYKGSAENMVKAFEKSAIIEDIKGFYEDMSSMGSRIGSMFIDSLVDGAESEDFGAELGEYLREQLIKVLVYTDEFVEKFSELSTKLANAITNNEIEQIKNLKNQIKDLYSGTKNSIKYVDELLSEIKEETIETTIEIADAMSEMGQSIGNSLADALTNGLNEGSFLDSMKNYIRKMIVQTVVYTESMKSEIEAIGKAISAGLADGFSSESLHEIRRDLSYMFMSANRQIQGIDEILSSVFSGYASGTNNATRGLHIVGEAGPELVRFNGGEQVYNANKTKDIISGNQSNDFTVNFYNTKDTTAYAMMSELRSYQKKLAFSGVL